MKCHIIGNGYSRDLFQDDGSYKVCLNLHSYECNLLFAVDDIAINYLANKNFYGTKAVISNHSNVEHENIIDRVPRYRKGIPYVNIDGIDPKKASFNVGHCAYRWLRDKGYNEIHLWGFDIFFNKSLVSLSDAIFGHSYKYKTDLKFVRKADKYLRIWNHIIDVPTYVHMHNEEQIVKPTSDNKYLKGIYHGNG